ncbi:MAG: hypothetical protein ACREDL_13815, partial [Bradyrhizobium sp.]
HGSRTEPSRESSGGLIALAGCIGGRRDGHATAAVRRRFSEPCPIFASSTDLAFIRARAPSAFRRSRDGGENLRKQLRAG